MSEEIKIAVAGTGYVGLSIATLLAQHHPVTAVDVIPEKVETLNRKQSPIQDEYIEKYLKDNDVQVDLGVKHTAYIPLGELSDDPNYDVAANIHVGDEIEAVVVRVNDGELDGYA